MQNMIRFQTNDGIIHVHFDIVDNEICNMSAKYNGEAVTVVEDEMREWLAREYIATTLEMAMNYRNNTVPMLC